MRCSNPDIFLYPGWFQPGNNNDFYSPARHDRHAVQILFLRDHPG